ncbi:hypothetical protein EYF80_018269 [Liparis tanakae]|uniref:Uncharacterized protein n=1 Tax=Liparis tanakae TaxID=230148 RepID=A0A4Z2I2W9_9TELE|nr:hypothetical protein EYF80_018269 [Liparis tanakae]
MNNIHKDEPFHPQSFMKCDKMLRVYVHTPNYVPAPLDTLLPEMWFKAQLLPLAARYGGHPAAKQPRKRNPSAVSSKRIFRVERTGDVFPPGRLTSAPCPLLCRGLPPAPQSDPTHTA